MPDKDERRREVDRSRNRARARLVENLIVAGIVREPGLGLLNPWTENETEFDRE